MSGPNNDILKTLSFFKSRLSVRNWDMSKEFAKWYWNMRGHPHIAGHPDWVNICCTGRFWWWNVLGGCQCWLLVVVQTSMAHVLQDGTSWAWQGPWLYDIRFWQLWDGGEWMCIWWSWLLVANKCTPGDPAQLILICNCQITTNHHQSQCTNWLSQVQS
jgi:hypothetical protein